MNKPRTYQLVNGPEHGKTIRLEREAYILRFQFGDYKIVRVGSRLFYRYCGSRFLSARALFRKMSARLGAPLLAQGFFALLILLVSRAILEAL